MVQLKTKVNLTSNRVFSFILLFFFATMGLTHSVQGQATIAINEFMASNATTLTDEDGDFEDWIELYNYGEEPVSLAGWGLSDHFAIPFQWVFPDTVLQPGEFLLVWASGKDRTENTLHTSFSINVQGEPLLLTHSSGNWIDFISPVAVPTDVSYGRQPDGTGEFYFFSQPTPGGTNDSEAFEGITCTPSFSLPGGFYSGELQLEISCDDPDVIIIYTLDGSEPRPDNLEGKVYTYKNQYAYYPDSANGPLLEQYYSSHLYSDPVLIDDRSPEDNKLSMMSSTVRDPDYFPSEPLFKGTVVRARAFREGMLSGPVVTQSYFVVPEGRNRFSLPVISLSIQEDLLFDYHQGVYTAGVVADTWREQNPDLPFSWPYAGNFHRRGPEWEYPAHMEYFPEEEVHSALAQDLGVRIHGGGTRSFPMKSMRLYARNTYGESHLSYPFFQGNPHNEFKRLLLRNAGQDFPANQGDTGTPSRTMFRDALQQKLVEHLSFDTQDYSPVIVFINGEYWGIQNIRERYDRHYLERIYGIEPGNLDLLTYHHTAQEGDSKHYFTTLRYIEDHGLEDPENYQYILTRIDEQNFMDYQIANIYFNNTDWPGNNIDFWRYRTDGYQPGNPYGKDGRWRWMMYDTDFGFGMWDGSNSFKKNTLAFATATDGNHWPNPPWSTFLLRSFLENTEFRHQFANRFADLLNTCFRHDHVEALINEMQDRIAPEMEEHLQRWAQWETLETWDGHVSVLRTFGQERPDYMWTHLMEFFDVPSTIHVEVDISHPLHGHVRVNTIDILPSTPGVKEEPWPWRGRYLRDIPVRVHAMPAPGYRFSHWEGDYESTDSILYLQPDRGVWLRVHFETTGEENLVYYWLLDEQIPNDQPLEELSATYSIAGQALLTYQSCLPDYPYFPEHPLWRQGSMERVNNPTPLNYRPEGNNGISYEDSRLRGIQVRQPFRFGGNESALIFSLPTTGLSNPVFRFAVKDEGAANALQIDFSFSEEIKWQQSRHIDISPALSPHYQLIDLDFSSFEAAQNNPWFKVRIRFVSDHPEAAEGKRVIFNNFSLDGVVCGAFELNSRSDHRGVIFPHETRTLFGCMENEFLLIPHDNHVIADLLLDGESVLSQVEVNPDHTGSFRLPPLSSRHELYAKFKLLSTMVDENGGITVYPNPVAYVVSITADQPIEWAFLYDNSGRLVRHKQVDDVYFDMQVGDLPHGIYMMVMVTGGERITRKVVVIRE